MQRPTSHRKGFTICADDFPVLDSKNSQSNGQQGVYMYHQIILPKSACSCYSYISKIIILPNNKLYS